MVVITISNQPFFIVPCKFVAVAKSKCPCNATHSTGCDILNECSSTQDIDSLCEADAALPDGTSTYEIDNCHGSDVFKCSPGK